MTGAGATSDAGTLVDPCRSCMVMCDFSRYVHYPTGLKDPLWMIMSGRSPALENRILTGSSRALEIFTGFSRVCIYLFEKVVGVTY